MTRGMISTASWSPWRWKMHTPLQLIIVDNELPPSLDSEIEEQIVLELNQGDRLVRASAL